MDEFSTPPNLDLPAIYILTPLIALMEASRRKLSRFLDVDGDLVVVNNEGIESDVVNDYSGLAELAGFDYNDLMKLKRQKSPTAKLLDMWMDKNGTVGKLWTYLYMMERYDVLTDCRLSIVRDCSNYETLQQRMREKRRHKAEQDLTVSISEMKVDETKFATVSDVKSGERIFFDVFVCYTPEDENDRQFLFKMIDELEVKRGLKLFVPGRDDLPGAAEHTITAYLIEKRCRRVVVLISRSFLLSEECDFQVKFALALSPGARSMKLIPVIREENTYIPRILRFLTVCDFTKSDMINWAWKRLCKAIKAPARPENYLEDEDVSNPFYVSDDSLKSIKFPSHHRSNVHEETLSPMAIPSEDIRPNAVRLTYQCNTK